MEIEQASSCYRSLYQVAWAINVGMGPERVLGMVARSVAVALTADGCRLALMGPDGTIFRSSYPDPVGKDWDRSLIGLFPWGDDEVLDHSADHEFEDLSEMHYAPPYDRPAFIVTLPATFAGEVIGTVEIHTREPRAFLQEEIDFVGATTGLAARCLGNRQAPA